MPIARRAPAIVQKWKRVVAMGCTHGELAHPEIQAQALAFVKRFKPHIRFELGDVLDTAAFRSGARGTPDEGRAVGPDRNSGIAWLEAYNPTHITWGNHDARLVDLAKSTNAVIAHAASALWGELQHAARHAQTREYDFERNWFEMGGRFWGHGFWYNADAVRDHAEYLGGPVVMAHLHAPQQVSGRTRNPSPSFCVGTLADIDKLGYARRRRATAAWGHGLVFGEVSDKSSQLWLASCVKGDSLRFPL